MDTHRNHTPFDKLRAGRKGTENMVRKGSSLIIALLMLAVISTASFGIARLAMVEMVASVTEAINTKAYYLAEGGIEESLLRWRYDHSAEIGLDSTESAKVWERINLTDGTLAVPPLTDAAFTSDVTFDKNYIGSTIYNKVSQSVGSVPGYNLNSDAELEILFNTGSETDMGNYVASRPDLKVTKDNKITFGFSDITTNLNVVWRWDKIAEFDSATATLPWASRGLNEFGVEVRLYAKNADGGDTLLAKQLFSPSGGNNIENSTDCGSQQACKITNIKAQIHQFAAWSPSGETYLTLTPIGADIVVGAFGRTDSGQLANYIDSITHLESVGVTGGRYKGLQVKLDKNSGRILGLYDYVLFEGSR